MTHSELSDSLVDVKSILDKKCDFIEFKNKINHLRIELTRDEDAKFKAL